jgi:hypothetical protein
MAYDTQTGQWIGDVSDAEDSSTDNTDQSGQGVQQVGQQVTQGAQQLAQQAQQTVGQATGQVAEQAKSQAATQKDKAADSLSSVAQALRQSGQQLQDNGQGAIAGAVNKGADQVDQLSDYLRQRDVNQLIAEAEDFARRQTPLFLAGAFALGVMAARFLKSSSANAPSQQTGYPGQGGYPRGGYAPTSGYSPHYAGSAYGAPSSYVSTAPETESDLSNGYVEGTASTYGETPAGLTGTYGTTEFTAESEA